MKVLTYDINRFSSKHKRKRPLNAIDKFRIITSNEGLKALMAYRLRRHIDSWDAPGLCLPLKWLLSIAASALCFVIRISYGINLDSQARIGAGLYIGHFGGIAIGRCQIGEHCSIGHQVRIGSTIPDPSGEGPVVGDHVWIGPHVTIMDDVVIESHATIASGSVVTSDVKQNTLVMGNPAKPIVRNYDNSYLL